MQDTQYDQFDNDQFITRLVLLGHMIQISPTALGDMGKRILNNISKYIVDKQQTNDNDDEDYMTSSFLPGNFTLLADEPHSDPEIGADTRVKVIERYIYLKKKISLLFNSVN
jgi:hypothetical protein